MELETLNEAANCLRAAKQVVVFTGAGVSAESGIPTFRDAGGLWAAFPPDRFATWRGIMGTAAKAPRELTRFLLALLEPLAAARPNPAHRAIAEIEKHTQVTVVTQNVDGLHQDAGTTRVLQVHGSLLEIVDSQGRHLRTLSRDDLTQIVERLRRAAVQPGRAWLLPWAIRPLAGLRLSGTYRPSIVLFGDSMADPDWPDALDAVERCDCFITVGTSGTVMPAAMLPSRARINGATVIAVGPEDSSCDIHLRGSAGEVMPALVRTAFPDVA